jgi:hypothetical protein
VVSTPLKNMKVSWDDYSHLLWKNTIVPNHQPDNSWTIVGFIMGIMVIMDYSW